MVDKTIKIDGLLGDMKIKYPIPRITGEIWDGTMHFLVNNLLKQSLEIAKLRLYYDENFVRVIVNIGLKDWILAQFIVSLRI